MNPPRLPQEQFDPQRFQVLLAACFLPDARAVEHFHAWNAGIDWNGHLHYAEFRLMPQLYRNLAAQHVEHPLLGKLRGIARKAWYNNNLMFHELARTLRDLNADGVEMMLLYGGAMALRYDNEYVLSNAAGVGLLIHPAAVRKVYAALARDGWDPGPVIVDHALDAYVRARYFTGFQNKKGERVVAQWQLLPHCGADDTEAGVWRHAEGIEPEDVPLSTLDPAAQVVMTCVYGNTPRIAPHWERVQETLLLLRACTAQVDWRRVVELAQAYQVIAPVREVLNAAQPVSGYVPTAALAQLNALTLSQAEAKDRVLWNAGTREERMRKMWRMAERRSCNTNTLQNALAFPSFLQHWWGLDSVWELVPRAFSAVRY